MNTVEIIKAIKLLEKEKKIDSEFIFNTIENAIALGLKKKQSSFLNLKDKNIYFNDNYEKFRVILDRETGDIKIFGIKGIDKNDVSFSEKELKFNENFLGRIVAQTTKQIIAQKLNEIQRNNIFNEFKNKEDDIVTGIVIRKILLKKIKLKDKDGNVVLNNKNEEIYKKIYNVFVSINNEEIILFPSEQVNSDKYIIGQRLKFYIVEVRKTTKFPFVLISRRNKNLIKKLFELEIPEINEGIIIIHDIVREAGFRTKISVSSSKEEVDPIGACIGLKEMRIRNILKEICPNNDFFEEKIDIITYSKDPFVYIKNALSPVKILNIDLNDEENKCKVLINKNMISLAIGKNGQNVRMAAYLTGWKIEIVSDETYIYN